MKKEEIDKIYEDLRKKYTDEEISESVMISYDMTEEDRIVLQKSIKERRNNMSEEEKKRISDFINKLKKDDKLGF